MSKLTLQAIDDLLPQTQCQQCGYKGCLPYAEALLNKQADINRCPPGGDATVQSLSRLLGMPAKPVDPECGQTISRHIASIQPEHCIGCTLCIKACPVDAIIGANKRRHSVIASLCTGCELCIPPCPVDCIDMVFLPQFSEWDTSQAHHARTRMNERALRLQRQADDKNLRLEQKAIKKLQTLESATQTSQDPEADKKRAVIEAALARARQRRSQSLK